MKTFNDNAGRSWTVQVNVDAIKRVRDLAQVNLLEVIEGKLLEKLIGDPVLLCDVIYCLCKPEADGKGISDVDFGRAMGGDAIDGAMTALLEELVDFFPQARRKVLAKALAKLRKLEMAALAAVETRLDSPELEREMTEKLQQLSRETLHPPRDGRALRWCPTIMRCARVIRRAMSARGGCFILGRARIWLIGDNFAFRRILPYVARRRLCVHCVRRR